MVEFYPALENGSLIPRPFASHRPGTTRLVEQNNSLIRENAKMRKEIMTDGKTGLLSQTGYDINGQTALAHAIRTHEPLTAARIDLDYFREINTQFGHPAGDYVLAQIGQKLKTYFRTADIVARFGKGADEFGILLQNCEINDAVQKLEQLRQKFEQAVVNYRGQLIRMPTLSIGLIQFRGAEIKEPEDHLAVLQELDRQADELATLSKNNGKNRITFKDENGNIKSILENKAEKITV